METLIQITQFIMSLSLLIVLHELGHFIPAKLFKTKVEKFYLFFDWPFSIFKKKFGETEYGIGILPLGGYVKIAGMIDESMDQEQLNKEPQEWEFRSKPTWQRLIIMVGGVTVNLILGFLIYIMMLFVWGDGYVSNEKIPYGAHLSNPIFESYGFQEGDLIIEAGDEKIIEFGSAEKRILIDGKRNIKIKRNKEIISLTLPENIIDELLKNKGLGILSELRIYNTIDSLIAGNNAFNAGLKVGDSIVGINGLSTPFFRDFRNELQKNKSQEVEIAFFRNNLLKTIKVYTNENGAIGYFKSNKLERSVIELKKYSIVEAIPSGIKKGTQTLSNYVKSLSLIFNKEGVKQIGGFGSIGSMFSNEWDWQRFWAMTALLSIILAFMNILPIPALDGGHVMFLIYEMIAGKPPSDQFLTRAQVAGMILLFSLLIYANGMDLYRFISG
jgi:regulator of sigma E protease